VLSRVIIYGGLTPAFAYDSPKFRAPVIEDMFFVGRFASQPMVVQILWVVGAFLMYLVAPITVLNLCLNRKFYGVVTPKQKIFCVAAFYLIMAYMITGAMFNGLEQERIRQSIAPAYLLLFSIWASYIWGLLEKRYRQKSD
jgi:hypothetical protein